MAPRKDSEPIFFRLEPELMTEVKEIAERSFEGNVSRFSRDAIRTGLKLRRLYGPRYELVISELIDGADAEKAIAA